MKKTQDQEHDKGQDDTWHKTKWLLKYNGHDKMTREEFCLVLRFRIKICKGC